MHGLKQENQFLAQVHVSIVLFLEKRRIKRGRNIKIFYLQLLVAAFPLHHCDRARSLVHCAVRFLRVISLEF